MSNENLNKVCREQVESLREQSKLHQLDIDPAALVAAADKIERLCGLYQGKCEVEDKLELRIEELESHVEMMRDALTQAKYACRTHHKQGLGYEPYKAVCGALESVPKNNLAHVKAEAVLGWGKANAQARKIHKAISPNLYAKQLINGEQQ